MAEKYVIFRAITHKAVTPNWDRGNIGAQVLAKTRNVPEREIDVATLDSEAAQAESSKDGTIAIAPVMPMYLIKATKTEVPVGVAAPNNIAWGVTAVGADRFQKIRRQRHHGRCARYGHRQLADERRPTVPRRRTRGRRFHGRRPQRYGRPRHPLRRHNIRPRNQRYPHRRSARYQRRRSLPKSLAAKAPRPMRSQRRFCGRTITERKSSRCLSGLIFQRGESLAGSQRIARTGDLARYCNFATPCECSTSLLTSFGAGRRYQTRRPDRRGYRQ